MYMTYTLVPSSRKDTGAAALEKEAGIEIT